MVTSQQLAVCSILIEDEKILTASRKDDHTKIGLPGGKVPQAAIICECFEETGMKVKINSVDSFAEYNKKAFEYFGIKV